LSVGSYGGPKLKISLKACPSPTFTFTGRRDILSQLHKSFEQTPNEPARQQRFVLYGLGGGGKTQIAFQFVKESQDRVTPR
jgi:hypothetical protein